MGDQGGRWVETRRPDGTIRQDWRPDEQPPSPDGGSGSWHVVSEDGGANRWEWVPQAAAFASPPASVPSTGGASAAGAAQATFLASPPITPPAANPRGSRLGASLTSRRGLVAAGLALVLVVGGLALGKQFLGGGKFVDPTPVDPASGVSLRPGQALSEQVGREVSASFGPFQFVTDAAGATRGSLQVTFTNNSAQAHSFEATITATGGADPAAIHEELTQVTGLGPGQSETRIVFSSAPADRFESLTTATFAVVRYISISPES